MVINKIFFNYKMEVNFDYQKDAIDYVSSSLNGLKEEILININFVYVYAAEDGEDIWLVTNEDDVYCIGLYRWTRGQSA